MSTRNFVLIAVLMSVMAGPLLAGELTGVWVTTDKSVDTSSPEAIVKCLVKDGMSDEAKALAVFNWYRRVIFPHNYLANDRRDVLRQINSYGCTLCGSHAANMGWLMRTAGFKTRCVFIHGGGHTFIEAWFDNGWHALDPETDFAVWSRAKEGEKPHLIGMEELKADPTLLDNAEKEGRAKPWFFKAMKFPFATRKKMAEWCDTNPEGKSQKDAMQWSSCVIKGETIKDYFIEGVKTLAFSKENESYGGGISDPDLMKLTLRAGEKLVRCWDNEGRGKFIAGQGFAGYPAHFMAGGEADESDTDIFPWIEPYRKDNYGIPELAINRCYRYSGNGHLIWTPKTVNELLQTGGVKAAGVSTDKLGASAWSSDPGKPGTITIPFRSSYALIDCTVRAEWTAEPGRVLLVGGKEPTEVKPTTQPESPAHSTRHFYGKAINGRFAYQLQIELPAKGGLKGVSFDHTFVNNPRALPFLVPGKNTVRVRLDSPELLKTTKLVVTYEWAEGDGWKTDKSDTREVTGSPFEYELTTPEGKFPRMKRLTLEAAEK
ncbi:MAG: transglutaminase-like domain-containing protein [Phycisphaerae bacterium]|nr:transglutaminase-like domain-containing protein [Phycisphaerae bacterium]